jgi:hypothetical protein
VLRALQELAREWRASIVAEGVETAEQLAIRSLGITAGQATCRPASTRERQGLASTCSAGRSKEPSRPPESASAAPVPQRAAGGRARVAVLVRYDRPVDDHDLDPDRVAARSSTSRPGRSPNRRPRDRQRAVADGAAVAESEPRRRAPVIRRTASSSEDPLVTHELAEIRG